MSKRHALTVIAVAVLCSAWLGVCVWAGEKLIEMDGNVITCQISITLADGSGVYATLCKPKDGDIKIKLLTKEPTETQLRTIAEWLDKLEGREKPNAEYVWPRYGGGVTLN